MSSEQAELQNARNADNGHRIRLTAKLVDRKLQVTGTGPTDLPKGSGSHRFDFELDDQTDLGVRFKRLEQDMLDVKDNHDKCPPPDGFSSTQIHAVTRTSDTRAGFTNRNNNRNGDMLIAYQLNFECDDAGRHPIGYDPVIKNGGTN